MGNTKIIFNDGELNEVIRDYSLTDEELASIKSFDASAKDEEEVDESDMAIDEIKAWTKAQAKGMTYGEFKQYTDEARKMKSTVISPGKDIKRDLNTVNAPRSKRRRRSRRPSKQEVICNVRGNESLRRTYIMEVENIQKLEEIKVLYYKNKYVQFSEILNDAVEHYYQCLMKK